jgi:mercuric ion transport protein
MTESSRTTMPLTRPRRTLGWADIAGALGAAFAALCCMGAPVILGVLGAVGLGWLRRDAILWPLMFLSLAVAFWGLSRDWRRHRMAGPLVLAALGAAALVAGVIFVHGLPARLLIYAGAAALVAATLWNIMTRRLASRSGTSQSQSSTAASVSSAT